MKITTVQASVVAVTDKKRIKADFGNNAAEIGFEKWLPFAAPAFNISPDPKDYLFYAVPLLYGDMPNRNGVAFPTLELLKWNVQMGRQAYKTWCGMPMHVEHQSEDPLQAIGVVVDTAMSRIENFANGKFWKVMALVSIDRNKNAPLAEEMEKGERTTYSMGAMVDGTTCSYCGAQVGKCNHIPDDPQRVTFYELNGQLVYKKVYGISGYEFSSVADPAYAISTSDIRIK